MLPPYPKYRSSGVEWLGDAPQHWEVRRLKEVVDRFVSGGTPSVSEETYWTTNPGGGYHWVAISDMDSRFRVMRTDRRITEAGRRAKDLVIVPPMTILYSMYASLGKVAVLDVPATFNQAILAIVPKAETARQDYLFFCLMDAARYVEALSSSNTQDNLNAEKVRNLRVFLPPLNEQRVIARFLEHRTQRIDVLVERQSALIERLREKRNALITRVVTCGLRPEEAGTAGLHPAPPLRASGAEWLGDMPAHWEVKRLKYLATINDEALPDTTPADQEMQYVDIGSVDSVKGVMTSRPLTFGSAPSRARRIVRDGDTIVSTVGTQCAVAAIREPAANLIVSTGFAVVRPRRMEPGYLSYAACESRFVETIIARSAGVIYPAIQPAGIATIPVPRPPEAEQRAIADYLDRETAKLDRLVGKVETAIERLREYRSALITAVVTGKVDVRGASGETGRAAAG